MMVVDDTDRLQPVELTASKTITTAMRSVIYHESSRTQPQLEWKCDVSVLCVFFVCDVRLYVCRGGVTWWCRLSLFSFHCVSASVAIHQHVCTYATTHL